MGVGLSKFTILGQDCTAQVNLGSFEALVTSGVLTGQARISKFGLNDAVGTTAEDIWTPGGSLPPARAGARALPRPGPAAPGPRPPGRRPAPRPGPGGARPLRRRGLRTSLHGAGRSGACRGPLAAPPAARQRAGGRGAPLGAQTGRRRGLAALLSPAETWRALRGLRSMGFFGEGRVRAPKRPPSDRSASCLDSRGPSRSRLRTSIRPA